MKKKVLLIRLDKIGDLISTLCVDQVDFLQDCEVRWVIAQGLSFVPENSSPRRTYLELSKTDVSASLANLRKFLKDFKPDVAVSFQAPWWVNYALWREGVEARVGVQSQWHSFLFLNRGLRQKRSQAVQHEADYNLELLEHAFSRPAARTQKSRAPVLKLEAPVIAGLLEQFALTPQKYTVVHPGMAGSALNWPITNYIQLIEELVQSTTVVLTGTPADEPWLKDIKEKFKDHPKVICLQNRLNTSELLWVLKNARVVIVPSTGVAHLAASLGTPVFGIYSHVRVQKPLRWAARGSRVHIFEAPTQNKTGSSCDGEHCEEFHCMEKIRVEDLLQQFSALD